VAAFYLDNDVATGIAAELIALGHVATTALAQNLRRANDAQQLLTATEHGWILVVHNYADFLLLHRAWRLWRSAGPAYQLPAHAAMLGIPQQRWLDSEAARQIDAFIQTNPPLTDMLYQWTPSQGWVSRH
jgi:hypothetical protein